MSGPKVLITRASAVSALGVGLDELSANLPGDPGPGSVKAYEFHELDRETPCFPASRLDPVAVLGKKGLRTKDWATKLLLATIELACKDRFDETEGDGKPGICVGTAFGSVQSIGDFLSDSIVNGVNAVNPQAFANTVINSPTGNANIRHQVRTLSTTVATGFNAGLDALLYSYDYLRRGYLPAVVAGGLEELSYYAIMGMQRSGVLSPRGLIQPFGTAADGFVPGEGCAMFLLETEESARARGASPIAEIAGVANAFEPGTFAGAWASGSDAVRYVMREACAGAGIDPADVGFVAASANGTRPADAMEAAAIAEVLGGTPVTAYKARLGECYGASPALSLACALCDLKAGRITGVPAGYETEGGINLVVDSAAGAESGFALINAFSCDGNCTSIVLKNVP
ncbi:MAG: hypothetical protein GF418_05625 [Chitinivibrionales bacterium]|nr:hypothetical protein [Chitinivibrionales bacterium]MBD3395090.1 hypothetical protein [Chitinivibrionales bacterium]